jgi:hypothetical protein
MYCIADGRFFNGFSTLKTALYGYRCTTRATAT